LAGFNSELGINEIMGIIFRNYWISPPDEYKIVYLSVPPEDFNSWISVTTAAESCEVIWIPTNLTHPKWSDKFPEMTSQQTGVEQWSNK
jgi:hypothetical protein